MENKTSEIILQERRYALKSTYHQGLIKHIYSIDKRYWEHNLKMWTFPIASVDSMRSWFKANKMPYKVVDERSHAVIVVYQDRIVVDIDNCFINKHKLAAIQSCESRQPSPNDDARGLIVYADTAEEILNKIVAVFDSTESYKYEIILNDGKMFMQLDDDVENDDLPITQGPEPTRVSASPPAKRACRYRK